MESNFRFEFPRLHLSIFGLNIQYWAWSTWCIAVCRKSDAFCGVPGKMFAQTVAKINGQSKVTRASICYKLLNKFSIWHFLNSRCIDDWYFHRVISQWNLSCDAVKWFPSIDKKSVAINFSKKLLLRKINNFSLFSIACSRAHICGYKSFILSIGNKQFLCFSWLIFEKSRSFERTETKSSIKVDVGALPTNRHFLISPSRF